MLDAAAFAAAAESDDPFALARLEKPGHKLWLLRDPDGTGYEFILAIPPAHHRFELLPETQESTINRKAKADAEASLSPSPGTPRAPASADASTPWPA